MKLKERRNLIGKCSMCLSFRRQRDSAATQGAEGRVGIQNNLWTTQRHSQDPFKRETESLATIVNSVKSLTVVAKLFILDVWRVPSYVSATFGDYTNIN